MTNLSFQANSIIHFPFTRSSKSRSSNSVFQFGLPNRGLTVSQSFLYFLEVDNSLQVVGKIKVKCSSSLPHLLLDNHFRDNCLSVFVYWPYASPAKINPYTRRSHAVNSKINLLYRYSIGFSQLWQSGISTISILFTSRRSSVHFSSTQGYVGLFTKKH